ncbi:MAG: hypothetical protein V9G12_19385 [Microthrixaceae bacterium]
MHSLRQAMRPPRHRSDGFGRRPQTAAATYRRDCEAVINLVKVCFAG